MRDCRVPAGTRDSSDRPSGQSLLTPLCQQTCYPGGMESLLVAVLAGGLVGALVAWPVSRAHVRNSLITERERMRAMLAQARVDLEEAADQLERWSKRGARERQRVIMAERRAAGSAETPEEREQAQSFASLKDYQRHLNRGGKRDREYEATMGWQVDRIN